MREKIAKILNRVYTILIATSFFAGILPLLPFIIAIIVGGSVAEDICMFIYRSYYPWVILAASVSILIGLISMYVVKFDFTIGNKKNKQKKDKPIDKKVEEEENEKN